MVLRADDTRLERFEFTEPHMGTIARIVLYADTATRAQDAARLAFARIAELDATFSDYRPESELSRFSDAAGGPLQQVSPDLFALLSRAQHTAGLTGGAFDITAGALTRLWRSARRLSELPDAARIADARTRAGYELLELNDQQRTARLAKPGVRLDAGGIAKGLAADAAIDVLARHGLPRALASLGGDVVVNDAPPWTDGWSVEIAGLDAGSARPPRLVSLAHAAVSTSGDAAQWMTAGGVRYSHVLDPRTGWPMKGRSSTTVIAPHGMDADALSTALAVLGPADGEPIANALPGVAALWQTEQPDGTVAEHASKQWPRDGGVGLLESGSKHDRRNLCVYQ